MSDKPLVSAIIIFLNAERFIREAIESVLSQTYDRWELLLVDDGSTDASTKIAQRYAAEQPGRVHYLHHPGRQNRGMSASRNLGIHHAQGKYIAFLDADDVWLPHKLEQQVAILDAHPEVALVYGRDRYWYQWAGNSQDTRQDFVPQLGVAPLKVIPPPTLLPLFLRGKAMIPCPTGILARRAEVERVGGFEESFLGPNTIYEDQAFYAKLCFRSSVIASDAVWDKYRQHPDASCSIAQQTGREIQARQFFLRWLVAYLDAHRVEDREVWQAVREALWLSRSPTWLPVPRQTRRLVRWLKKWLLRVTERALPKAVQQWLWTQRIETEQSIRRKLQ